MNDRKKLSLAVSTLLLGVATSAQACPDQAEAQAQARSPVAAALKPVQQSAVQAGQRTEATTVAGCDGRKCTEQRIKRSSAGGGSVPADSAVAKEQQRLVDAAKMRLAKNS